MPYALRVIHFAFLISAMPIVWIAWNLMPENQRELKDGLFYLLLLY